MVKRFWSVVMLLAVLMLVGVSVVDAQVDGATVTPPSGWVNAICQSSEAQPLYSMANGRIRNARLRLLPNTVFFVPEAHTAGQYVPIRYESNGVQLSGAFIDMFRCQLREGTLGAFGGGVSIANVQYLQDDATITPDNVVTDDSLTTTLVRETMPDWAVWLLGAVFLLTALAVYYALYVVQKSQWHISNSVPASSVTEFLKQAGHAAGTAGLQVISGAVERTPMQWDDDLLEALLPKLVKLLDEYFDDEAKAPSGLPTVEEVG